MRKAIKRLADLQARLARAAEGNAPPGTINRLCVTPVAGLVLVDYFGTPFDPFQGLLEAVVTPEVAAVLASLTVRGPDEGSNGTRNWDISLLADSDVAFPRLRAVSIEQT